GQIPPTKACRSRLETPWQLPIQIWWPPLTTRRQILARQDQIPQNRSLGLVYLHFLPLEHFNKLQIYRSHFRTTEVLFLKYDFAALQRGFKAPSISFVVISE